MTNEEIAARLLAIQESCQLIIDNLFPEPDVEPEPEPQPEPEPTPEPDPEPLPEPQPEPAPEPTPDPEPEPDPAPVPDPAPGEDTQSGGGTVPAPIPSGGPRGSRTLGRDIATCTEPGVIVTASDVTITQALTDFSDWDIGTRRLSLKARVGHIADLRSINGVGGTLPLMWIMPGGGFDVAEYVSALGSAASMVFKQESGAVASLITGWDMRGMSQDALKVTGGNIIDSNTIGDATFRGGAPHADVLTCMSADGGVIFRNNDVDWNYAGQTDQSGINNWFRIETYAAASNTWDDIIIEGNRLRHAHPISFAMQVAMKNSPTWRGSIKVRNNVMDKAGGTRKIYYGNGVSPHITEWTGNVDASGNPIPLSAI